MLTAFTSALSDVFLVCIPFIVLALLVAFFLREVPLRMATAPPARPDDSEETGPPVYGGGH